MHDHHVIVKEVDYKKKTVTLTGLEGHITEDGDKIDIVTKKKEFADLEGSLFKIEYENVKIIKKGKRLKTLFHLRDFLMCNDEMH